jgi:hypothetical protein
MHRLFINFVQNLCYKKIKKITVPHVKTYQSRVCRVIFSKQYAMIITSIIDVTIIAVITNAKIAGVSDLINKRPIRRWL